MGLVEQLKSFVAVKGRLDLQTMATAIPSPNSYVTAVEGPDGTLTLEAPLEMTGSKLWSAMARRSKANPIKKFELEQVGAFIWKQCDGKTSFQTLSKRVQREYKLTRVEADASLGAFLLMLSQRRLITMMVDKKK